MPESSSTTLARPERASASAWRWCCSPPLLFLSKLAGMQFLAVSLAFAAAVYFGFAVSDGRLMPLVVEFAPWKTLPL